MQERDRAHHVVQVRKRLAHSHEHHMADLSGRHMLQVHELLDYLKVLKVPLELECPGAAEPASHCATGLAGQTRGELSLLVCQKHALDDVPVMKLQGKLGCPVRVALACHHLA